ncbi:MAG: hypothetical protein Q8L90_19100 [Bacteroidota bacterium]|nr:hypothetical protein [Bacteroidota bacterium]
MKKDSWCPKFFSDPAPYFFEIASYSISWHKYFLQLYKNKKISPHIFLKKKEKKGKDYFKDKKSSKNSFY